MDQERHDDAGEDVRPKRCAKVIRTANDHIARPLPRTPGPHENVSDDGDDEEHPRSVNREAMRGPVRVVEKVAIDFGYLIVADFVNGTDRWIERCHDDPLSGDERPYIARLFEKYRVGGYDGGVARATRRPRSLAGNRK